MSKDEHDVDISNAVLISLKKITEYKVTQQKRKTFCEISLLMCQLLSYLQYWITCKLADKAESNIHVK